MSIKSVSRPSYAVRAGLGLLLALGIGLPGTTAYAAEASVTITQRNNEQATYDAYQIFAADISEDDQATHVAWASPDMQRTVLAFLDSHGYTQWLADNHPGGDQRDRPQNAAEYLAQQIASSRTDEGANTTPRTTAGSSFANELAQFLASNSAHKQTALSGEPFKGAEGYWLFVTTDATTQDYNEAGSAPIYLALGGSVSTVYEKSSVPTIDKEVLEDSTDTWGKVADANVLQALSYRLTGTLPTNYGAFAHYHYKFTDTLSDGLDLAIPEGTDLASSLVVRIGERQAPIDGENLKATYANRVLTIEFSDLKSPCWEKYGITKDTVISVTYQAHLNASCRLGAPGNPNDVWLTYTDDPVSEGDGRTREVPVKVFAYKLRLTKTDGQTLEPLAGAVFSIQVAESNADATSRGMYVQADGSLANEAHRFETNDDGLIEVQGLDEGTYRICELASPDGYTASGDAIDLVITSTLDGTGRTLTALQASVDVPDGQQGLLADVSEVDGNAGTVLLNVSNDRLLTLPLTGQAGLPLGGLVALAMVGGSSFGLWQHRSSRTKLS